MILEETKLVVGRGEVYFEPFVDGTRVGDGERYIGNTTTFQVARTVTRLERFTSYKGQQVEREGAVLSESHTVQFITDNIAIENVGLWFGKETSESTFQAEYFVTETITVRQNRLYQLGKTVQPLGVRYVDNVSIKIGGVTVTAEGNYELDKPYGRIAILSNAPDIPNGSTLSVTFDWRTVRTETATSHTRDLFGSLRFIATNTVGPKRNYYFPFVRLSPRGAMDLKGDEWQQMPFEAEAMRLTPFTEQVYVDVVIHVDTTQDEQAILDEGLTFAEFLFWDDELNTLINVTMPGHDLGAPLIYP